MTLKKWFFLFWTTMAVGALASMICGYIMLITDQEVGFLGFGETGFNLFMMFLAGTLIGAFSQMCFFAYLTLNYIALSVFRKKYLWTALQMYITIFGVFLLGYLLYQGRADNWFFWVFPLSLLVASLLVAWFKVKQTNKSAFIPTLFLMFIITTIESYPAMQGENNIPTILFMLIPLFVCNFYQNHQMARLTSRNADDMTAPTIETTA